MVQRTVLVLCSALLFSFGMYWTVERNILSDHHTPNPKFKRKIDRMVNGNPNAGYPGEAMQWWFGQRAIPTGEIPVGWRERALEHIQQNNLPDVNENSSALSWTAVGPNNIAGRTRSIAIDPGNASIMYCGSVSGGIFKTTNAGTSWFPTNDLADNLAIGDIVIDPTNSNILYAGTGEGFFNSDAIRGAGVLKSTNGGTTWTLQTSFSGGGFPYQINDLYIRSDAPATVYAASNTGLFRTTNGGTSWTYLHGGLTSLRATQIVRHPTDPLTFYVCYGNFSTDGIYKTTNGGTNFAKLTGGGLPASGYTRVSMAIAPSNGSTLYAVFNATNNTTRGIFRSTNAGTSWDSLAKPMDPLSGATHLAGQGWYNNVIAVDPANASIVYVGGINLYKTTNDGTSWTMISNWYSGAGYPYVHADQHVLLFSGSTLWIGNDGGVFRTTNGGTSYTEMVSGLATIQYYSGAIHPTSDIFYGGTQDNGTLKAASGGPGWTVAFGGDGGHTWVDFTTPATVWTEYVYLNIQKSVNSGSSWTKTMNGIPTSGGGSFDGTSDRCLFIAPFTMDPSNSQRIAAGTYRVFLTTNSGTLWSAISTDLTGDGAGGVGASGSTISAIAIAPSNPAVIYVGTSGAVATSRIQVTTNSGTNWTNVTTGTLPNRYTTRVVIDPNNVDRAWALYSGFGTGHVFLTTNRGTSWTNASGNLPDIPVNAGAVNPANQNNVIVGTDLGIFETTNGGTSWSQQNSGLANVAIADLDLRNSDKILFAATHGRGMFKTTSPLTAVGDDDDGIVHEFRLSQNYPNPFNPSTVISYQLATSNAVTLRVYDLLGNEVATLVNRRQEAGRHSAEFNAAGLSSGAYFYRLEAGTFIEQRKMILMK
ncbi:MAG: T9SS type A sorting domain-containing protein [Bacteroidota bacterium]